MGGKYLSVWWTLLLSIIQVLALGTCSTLAFQLGQMVRSIVDTWVIHIGCVLWTGNIMWDLLDMAQGNTHTYTPYMYGMIYTGVLGFFLQMQLLHLWSDPKKWEEFGLLRVCRVLSRLPSPRTRDKSIVAKFQQQNLTKQSKLVKLVCPLVLSSVMFFTRLVNMMARSAVRLWRAPL